MKYKIFLLMLFNSFALNCAEASSSLKIFNKTGITLQFQINHFYQGAISDHNLQNNQILTLNLSNINILFIYNIFYDLKEFNFELRGLTLDFFRIKQIDIVSFNGHIALNLINDENKMERQYIKKLPNVAAPGCNSENSFVNATPG